MNNSQFKIVEDDNKALHSEFHMHVIYKIKEGKRNEFIQKVMEAGIITASKQETGNLFYQYFFPIDDNNSVLLIEAWVDANAQAAHCTTENFKRLSEIKKDYVEKVIIKKYDASIII